MLPLIYAFFIVVFSAVTILFVPNAYAKREAGSWTIKLNSYTAAEQTFQIGMTPPILSEDYEAAKKLQWRASRVLAIQMCLENNPGASKCEVTKALNVSSDMSGMLSFTKDSGSREGEDFLEYRMTPSLSEDRTGHVFFIKDVSYTKKDQGCEDLIPSQVQLSKYCENYCGSEQMCTVDHTSVLDATAIGNAKLTLPFHWPKQSTSFAAQSSCIKAVKLFCPKNL